MYQKLKICVRISKVTMMVDGTYSEKWSTSSAFSMLSSNQVFVGGSDAPYKLPGNIGRENFVGCLRKVISTMCILIDF
jgi:hypothetical protein